METRDFGAGFAGSLSGSLGEVRSLAKDFSEELAEATKSMQSMDGEARRLSRSLSSSLRTAFDKAVFGGEKLSGVFRDLAGSVAGKALDSALKPVQDSIGGAVGGLFGGLTTGLGSAFAFQDGGAFSAGRVRAFAKGGVVSGPTLFPMRGGTGLMGEAGPEAIMPLRRGPDGKLGVSAGNGTGSSSPVVVNISTPDVSGFERSRGQVSAQLARAVARGRRNL